MDSNNKLPNKFKPYITGGKISSATANAVAHAGTVYEKHPEMFSNMSSRKLARIAKRNSK